MIVLIHGGFHNKLCWSQVERLLKEMEKKYISIVLPGHGDGNKKELGNISLSKCINSIMAQLCLDEPITLVLHSMAGIFLYKLYEHLEDRIEKIVCISCCIPKNGETMIDSLGNPLRWLADYYVGRVKVVASIPKFIGRGFFGNGMSRRQRNILYKSMCGEGTALLKEKIYSCDIGCRVVWVYTTKDRALSRCKQNTYINNLGCVEQIIRLTAPHDVMITNPEEIVKTIIY